MNRNNEFNILYEELKKKYPEEFVEFLSFILKENYSKEKELNTHLMNIEKLYAKKVG